MPGGASGTQGITPASGDSGEWRLRAPSAPSAPDHPRRAARAGTPRSTPRPLNHSGEPAPELLEISPEEARDRALVHAWRAGDSDALAELLERYQDRLYAICFRMTSDPDSARDLAQESMVKVIQGLPQFGGRSKLSTWMFRVAINVCLTDRRRQRLRKTASLDLMRSKDTGSSGFGSGNGFSESLAGGREPGAFSDAKQSEERELLYAGMSRIDESQRAIIILRDVHDLDYHQIADILDIAGGTVKSRLFRARQALRDEIERLAAQRAAARRGSNPAG